MVTKARRRYERRRAAGISSPLEHAVTVMRLTDGSMLGRPVCGGCGRSCSVYSRLFPKGDGEFSLVFHWRHDPPVFPPTPFGC